MLQKHSILLSSILLVSALHLNAQEEANAPAVTLQLAESLDNASLVKEEPILAATRLLEPFTGVICGSKVRMRTQPNLEAHVVRETSNGEYFAVLGETNGYYAVTPPKGTKGYVFRTFILDNTVEGERVNVRLYPDIDAPVIGQLNTGDKVSAVVSDINNKWLEIDLPDTSRFYIAKEYIENKGPVELAAQIEKKRSDASHQLSAACLFAQSEIQKPFEQIDLDCITDMFGNVSKDYQDFPSIADQAKEAISLIQDIYVQKKVAFLESKANHRPVTCSIDADQLSKLAKLGIEIQPQTFVKPVTEIASAASETVGLASTMAGAEITDKMLLWVPLEEALYHLWATANGDKGIEEFYAEEKEEALMLTGIVEPYNRPVKNRPGDFLLRSDNMPVAFLYSTQINLEKVVGQKVTLLATPRPNHNFAFPAYFVISLE